MAARSSKKSLDRRPLIVGDLLDFLLPEPGGLNDCLYWPPDVFAVVATILRRSGAYSRILSWPRQPEAIAGWTSRIKEIGERWRTAVITGGACPAEIKDWWEEVLGVRGLRLAELANHNVCSALIQLSSAADEACTGIGIWDCATDRFDDRALTILQRQGTDGKTLCERVDPTRAIVLPKLHTPKSGLSIHSLTHNLAICDPTDVVPLWYSLPVPSRPDRSLNVLLLPWPDAITPRCFSEVLTEKLPKGYGFFTYCPQESLAKEKRLKAIQAAVEKAKALVSPIHGVVLPELALEIGECERLCKALGCLVIGGEGKPGDQVARTPGRNEAVVAIDLTPIVVTCWRQPKHHRWKLDGRQIDCYGLGAQLDPNCEIWEWIEIGRRHLHFWTVAGWLTFSVLICEDLARPEPVIDVLRAVGPNLVIALLMDGPQLSTRWAARYATILADDPGSSVLTLTSIGMANLSRPAGGSQSRVVALWKDAGGDPREITLPDGAVGTVLCLTRNDVEEFSADHRSDGGSTGYVRLRGVHPVWLDQ